ncbi:unnamed protein product [Didymodactylos carnosus]|uniref:Cyclin A n=1 Tax=Didymodactylos carnosus TaxID=1234261 RepID=A0A8S2PLG0_9BILA|nr:unnamed protein product [Didymodactylos carnosus]CAF4057278.1 unnamed protein product [Didymodactylos carnosus]
MTSNRLHTSFSSSSTSSNILKQTNRLPLKVVPQIPSSITSTKLINSYNSQPQPILQNVNKTKLRICDQENVEPQTSKRCIAQEQELIPTTIKGYKQPLQPIKQLVSIVEQQQDESMFISPIIVTTTKQSQQENEKDHSQLEQDLYELPDYRMKIFEHLKLVEHLYESKPNFMAQQIDINAQMRTILVDWLIEVADEYKLFDETLFLCVQYVDRFLSTVNVTRSKLQLLGTTCMYLAAKYEEMCPPALEEFSFITDNTYDTKHILRMEQIVMKMLNFSLSGPTSYIFLQHYLSLMKSDIVLDDNVEKWKCFQLLSSYLITLTLLQDQPYCNYRSSIIAASCLCLALKLYYKYDSKQLLDIWRLKYEQLTSYKYADLIECTNSVGQLFQKTYHQQQLSTIVRRYLNYNNVLLNQIIHVKTTSTTTIAKATVNNIAINEEEEEDEEDNEEDYEECIWEKENRKTDL